MVWAKNCWCVHDDFFIGWLEDCLISSWQQNIQNVHQKCKNMLHKCEKLHHKWYVDMRYYVGHAKNSSEVFGFYFLGVNSSFTTRLISWRCNKNSSHGNQSGYGLTKHYKLLMNLLVEKISASSFSKMHETHQFQSARAFARYFGFSWNNVVYKVIDLNLRIWKTFFGVSHVMKRICLVEILGKSRFWLIFGSKSPTNHLKWRQSIQKVRK